MKNFGIITVNHLRPKVLRMWCAQIKRLRYDLNCYIPAVCTSSEEDKVVCDEYNVVHFTRPNQPVSEKFNQSFKYMWGIGVDYVMILGSDNFISTELMRNTIVEMDKGTSLIGINSIYFYSGDGQYKGQMINLRRKQPQAMLGPVKTISKDILDAVAWRPFPKEMNWGLDGLCSRTIEPFATTKAIVDGFACDLKTKDNLNKWTCFGTRLPKVPPELFYDILSEEEKQILKTI